MLDVHVLVTHRLPPGWLEQSINSVVVAALSAPFRVNVHLSPESTEDFWKARWDGYARGTAPWATYVDADDWVDPNAFAVLEERMRTQRSPILTCGTAHDISSGRERRTGLGLVVHPREAIDAADKDDRAGCCPSCLMLRTNPPIRTMDRVHHRRVGYASLAGEWRKKNGMG